MNDITMKIPGGLEPETARSLELAFGTYFAQADEWRAKASVINVTDASQLREMKLARETRLAVKSIRVEAEKTRKRLKEDSLRKGKAIDGMYNMLAFAIKPLEQHLEDQERFVERLEADRKRRLGEERAAKLADIGADASVYANLGDMSADKFDEIVDGHLARLKAMREAEEARVAKEKADAEERACVAAENERLRKEAEAREKQIAAERAKAEAERKAAEEAARKERAAAEAKLAAERAEAERQRLAAEEAARKERQAAEAAARAEREKIEAARRAQEAARRKAEAELAAKRAAEEKAAREKAEAERRAAAAPDRDKLNRYADMLLAVPYPRCDTKEGKAASDRAREIVDLAVDEIRSLMT